MSYFLTKKFTDKLNLSRKIIPLIDHEDLGGVLKYIEFMIKNGCKSNNLTAVIGPCISVENYEVKKGFKDKFLKKDKNNIRRRN